MLSSGSGQDNEKGTPMNANLFMFSLFFAVLMANSIDANAQQDWREEHYKTWRQLAEITNGSVIWDTEHNSNQYIECLTFMMQNRFDMLDYMCNKIANANYDIARDDPNKLKELYRDFSLLGYLGSIDIAVGITYQSNILMAITSNVPRFQREWRGNTYRTPDRIIKDLCEKLMLRNTSLDAGINDEVNMRPIRWYGIFAAPELVRQVKSNNSQYAFYALLRIFDSKEAAKFFTDKSGVRQAYVDKSSKIEAISKWYEQYRDADHTFDIMKRIGEILED